MFGGSPHDPQADFPIWAAPFPRNVARGILIVAVVTLSIVGSLVLMCHQDTDPVRNTKWSVHGVQFLEDHFRSWREESKSFCAYVESTKSGESWKTSPYAKKFPPTGGSVDITALCAALNSFSTTSPAVLWSSVVIIFIWAIITIFLAMHGPWRLRDRHVVLSFLGATVVLCVAILTCASVWESKFSIIASLGINTTPSLGIFFIFGAAVLTFFTIAAAALDAFFVIGYDNLNRYRWNAEAGNVDMDGYNKRQPWGNYNQFGWQQEQEVSPQYVAPMGYLVRPGEVQAGPAMSYPEKVAEHHGGKAGRNAFGYGA